ncbi:MAG: hypothetical protein G01um101425_404 [Candidatus Peregrinibacteria bacterium Gr01-1014_25]|nr:MAG: hypothetical protein G01um101425_404 [Candidatus Peregrinibacteria bacterium Gr01-1014_25]
MSLLSPSSGPQKSIASLDRRQFGGHVLRACAAFAGTYGLLLPGCKRPHEQGAHSTHELTEDEKLAQLQLQQQHPFHRNATQWLRKEGGGIVQGCDTSAAPVTIVEEVCVEDRFKKLRSMPGLRYRRTPGAGILSPREKDYRFVKQTLALHGADRTHPVTFIADSHKECGAALKFAKDHGLDPGDADAIAQRELQERVKELHDSGVDARYGEHLSVDGFHAGIMAIVDGTYGRLHDYRKTGLPQSYVVSTPDDEELADGLGICMDVARSHHAYGDLLEAFTILAIQDPKNRDATKQVMNVVERVASTRKNLRVAVVPWIYRG